MSTNPNQDICDMLMKLGEYERDTNGLLYKFIAYRKASLALESYGQRVKSGKEAKTLPGIGAKIAQKIDEFLEGDKGGTTITDSPSAKSSPTKVDSSKASSKPSTSVSVNFQNLKIIDHLDCLNMTKLEALRLQAKQVNTISDLLQTNVINSLTEAQSVCLRHFDDLRQKIAREEVKAISKIIRNIVEKVSEHIKVIICGSHRRGARESDRIKLLLVHSKIDEHASVDEPIIHETLRQVVKALKKEHLLTDCITFERDIFHGLVQQKPSAQNRRIELRLVPKARSTCALLDLTGSESFCQQLTQHALATGFILDRENLRKIGYTCVAGQPILVKNEEQLFEFIEHQFIAPEQRE